MTATTIPQISYHFMVAHPRFEVMELAVTSDLDSPELPRGRTVHGYFLEGWDDAMRERMQTAVLDRNLNANNGNFGDGQALSWRDETRWMAMGAPVMPD